MLVLDEMGGGVVFDFFQLELLLFFLRIDLHSVFYTTFSLFNFDSPFVHVFFLNELFQLLAGFLPRFISDLPFCSAAIVVFDVLPITLNLQGLFSLRLHFYPVQSYLKTLLLSCLRLLL